MKNYINHRLRLGDVIKIIPQGRGPQVTRSEHEVSEVESFA
jgi:hypothetical protein